MTKEEHGIKEQPKSQTKANTEGTEKREGGCKGAEREQREKQEGNQESRSSRKMGRTCYWISCVAPREGGGGLKRSPRL